MDTILENFKTGSVFLSFQSPSNEWLKIDLLIEFGQWLYSNEFPLQDAIDQIEWAVDIILNMKTESDAKKEPGMCVC